MDFQIVPSPIKSPGQCATCGNHKGPILDTMRDIGGVYEIYICSFCAERIAQGYGYLDKEDADSLRDSSRKLLQASKELAERDKMISAAEEQIQWYEDQRERLIEENSYLNGKVEQLRSALDRVRNDAIAQVEAVTGAYTHDELG